MRFNKYLAKTQAMRAACQMNHSSHSKHTRNLSHSKVKNFYELGKIIILWLKNIHLYTTHRYSYISVLYLYISICVYPCIYLCIYICLHVHEINISAVERQQILSLLAEFKLLETDRTDFAGKVHCGACPPGHWHFWYLCRANVNLLNGRLICRHRRDESRGSLGCLDWCLFS